MEIISGTDRLQNKGPLSFTDVKPPSISGIPWSENGSQSPDITSIGSYKTENITTPGDFFRRIES